MKLRDLLQKKGSLVITAGPDESLAEAIQRLVENRIGALLVTQGDQIVGIVTERDILREAGSHAERLGERRVREAMTSRLVSGGLDDEVHHAMGVMTRNKIRHLPVLEEGALRGLISIGDLVWSVLDEAESENRHLKEYIAGGY
ncbi:MAG: CBS domain-containing protein [Gemmatimonadota bacterium]